MPMVGFLSVGGDYENLMVTEEFTASVEATCPALTDDDLEGLVQALDDLDTAPANLRNRLHRLDRELADWWSLTPPPPANPSLRIILRPERSAAGGFWRFGPVAWHYAR